MSPEEIDDCFEFVRDLVRKCGEVLLEGFKDCGEVTIKTADHDLVTFYDGKIEEILIEGIKEKYPDHKFIAEEDSATKNRENILTSLPSWIIDPIDGTINFVKRLHFVCISVAFVIDRQLNFAFLYNPTLNEFFHARKNQGAFLNGKIISASKKEELRGSLVAHEISLGCVPEFTEAFIERARIFLLKTIGIRAIGSAALTLGYVANGTIDAYNIEHLKPWDIAAGALIIKEAGGVVIDKNGGEINLMKPDIIAAGTMKMAMEIKELLDEIDQKLEKEGKLPRQLFEKRNK
ncbi:hypothetical protein PVAND_016905 [Polypedilum vanderplanki]|uniref:Inositol-1-monophosphatase n=1 Tax=Polypedilum vanderplanki TaxID=319348 RepID=A0A9J6BH16_POLVA|nr:hypothetical protein PVAND_016905 [Polypedilum vanderplanki]